MAAVLRYAATQGRQVITSGLDMQAGETVVTLSNSFKYDLVAVVATASLLVFSLPAQAQNSGGAQDNTAGVPGNGEKPALSYANDHLPANAMLVQTGYEAAYDTNPLSMSGPVKADEEQRATLDWLLLHQGSRSQARIEYRPYYEFYARNNAYSCFNQLLAADYMLRLNNRWSGRIRDDFIQQTDPNTPQTTELAPSGIGTPSGLNQTVYVPIGNERENNARVDFSYLGGPRTSLDIFAGYDDRSYSGDSLPGSSTYGTRGPNGGLDYAWRSSEHLTIGILGMVQRMGLSGILPEESGSRMDIASLFPSVGWRPRPTLEMSVFAGPQFTRQFTSDAGATAAATSSIQARWAAGGTMTRKAERTSLFVSAQHMVSDGGGLLTFVTNSFVEAGVRGRLHGAWDAMADVMIARNNWLPLTVGQGNMNSGFAKLEVTRPLRKGVTLHFGYDFERQTYSGSLPQNSDFYRNHIVTAISWQWRPIPLGR